MLASIFAAHFDDLALEDEAVAEEEDPAVSAWIKERAPTPQPCWDPVSRWTERFRVKWSRLEHNNIGDMRIAVMTLKHFVRAHKNWGKHVLVFADSLVTLGALAKGRSSSWPLLRLA